MTLEGPGGDVGLGDTLDEAKKAFPAPSDAQVFDRAMNFGIVTQTGWGWGMPTGGNAFEAATKDGKIIGLALTAEDATSEPARTMGQIGQPTRRADGKTLEVFVWEDGDRARFWLHVKKKGGLLPVGAITVIGNKNDLKLLNYRSDDPQTLVKQMDGASEAINSPEYKKAFEAAKKRSFEEAEKNPWDGGPAAKNPHAGH